MKDFIYYLLISETDKRAIQLKISAKSGRKNNISGEAKDLFESWSCSTRVFSSMVLGRDWFQFKGNTTEVLDTSRKETKSDR
ncbi:hypothetical protein C7B70_24895 [Chlorogloea sp. CCALA 695]|nr:hypothetical protein C7B70_24895 [Chlorogloea sp. CCALA 695]